MEKDESSEPNLEPREKVLSILDRADVSRSIDSRTPVEQVKNKVSKMFFTNSFSNYVN